uniref:Uncharacterized protein n=1 Tax=Oryza punctata TaxID=4537 RepID=A0A0E0KD71_ORYPU
MLAARSVRTARILPCCTSNNGRARTSRPNRAVPPRPPKIPTYFDPTTPHALVRGCQNPTRLLPFPSLLGFPCFLALIGLPVFPPICRSNFGVEGRGGIAMAGNARGDSSWFLV